MSRLNMARKIRENHQNNNSKDLDYYQQQQIKEKNNEKQFIMAKMANAYGKKENYHLNEYNIEYMPGVSMLEKDSQKNYFRLRNIKHSNSKIHKGNDLLGINYLKEQFHTNNNSKHRGKSSYCPSNLTAKSNININSNKEVNNHKDISIPVTNDISVNQKDNIEKNNNNNNNNTDNDNFSKTDKLYCTHDNNNNNNFPNNINNYFMSCKFLFTMSLSEIEEYLELLWKQLGVKDSYINIFNSQKNNFSSSEELTDFLILEIENLKKFEDVLIKLNKEIESREKNICSIKDLCEKINKSEEDENADKKLMNDFFNSIISYRVHSIKVVEYYLLFKEKIIQGNIREKFDEEFIKKKYGLIKEGLNYLIKMKTDMSFIINNSKIYNNKDNIDIFKSFKGDPFLCCLYSVIPVSREYKQRIKYCHYYIIQETINENITKENSVNILNNNKRLSNSNLSDINEYKNYKKKKLEPIVNHNHYKEKNGINIPNQTEINKNKDFNMNEVDYTKKYNKSVINNNTNNLKEYELNKIKNKKNSNFDYQDDDLVNLKHIDTNNDYDNKMNLNKIQINNNDIEKQKYEDDINCNININNEIEKKEDNKNDIKKEENILQNSLSISKKMKSKKESSRSATPESKKITNIVPTTNKKNQNNENLININNVNNLNTSIILDDNTPKSYNTSYYCGSLSDFIIIYKNYYNRIPLEQKTIFNIKEDPTAYFQHNYYPKIIICSDKKLTLIKGICIYSLIFSNENKSNKIIIEHLSSYKKEEMEDILKNIFDFLKNNNILNNSCNNNTSNEIFIDLYFYLENEKFFIDTSIRDFIKNELKFKWVKLENVSKEIRYQKMKHQFNINVNNNLLNNEIDDHNILNQSLLGIKALKEMNDENSNSKNINEDLDNNTFYENTTGDNLYCNFYIKNKLVIKYMNKNEVNSTDNENKLIMNNIKYVNPFNILFLIKKISEDSIYSEYILNNTYNFFTMNDHLDLEEILNNNDGVSLNDILINNSFITSDIQQLINYFNNNNDEKKSKNFFEVNTKMNIMPLFDNCISVKYNNYYYNRIEHQNIKTLIEKETNQKFFFITPNNNKSDNNILLISSTLNEKFKNKYISPYNHSNIGLKFIDIYNNIISAENENSNSDKSDKKYLYIPSFDINSKIKNIYKNHKKPEKEEEFEDNNDTYVIHNYDEYFSIKCLSEDFIGQSTKYKNKKDKNKYKNSSTNFYYDKIEEDYTNNKDCVIDDNFIIFILNFDIIDNFAAIPLLSLYITKENFIS